MSDTQIRKYLIFAKKNNVKKNEAVKRLVTVHKLSTEEYKRAIIIAGDIYG